MMDNKEVKIKKKKKVEKEHDPVGTERVIVKVAVVLLVIMAATLLFLLFYDKDSALIVPDEPNYKEIEMTVIDFTKDKINTNVMETSEKDDVPVRYTTVSDFYENNIMMTNTTVDYLNKRFIVRSREYSKMAYVSSVTLKGEYEWDIILDDNKFDSVDVNKVIYEDEYYYVFMTKKRDSGNTLEVIKLNEKGKKKGNLVLAQDVDESISDAYFNDGQFAIVTTAYKTFSVYYMNEKLKLVETTFSSAKNKVISVERYIRYEKGYFDGDKTNIVFENGDKFVFVSVGKNGSATNDKLDAINKLGSVETLNISEYHDGFVAYVGQKIYKLNDKYEIVNVYDYSTVKLPDDSKYVDKDSEIGGYDGSGGYSLNIENVDIVNNFIIVKASTWFSNVYDIYDKHLNLKKRYTFDFTEYNYEHAVLLNSFYIDDKMYELYSWGAETPSIMISVLG